MNTLLLCSVCKRFEYDDNVSSMSIMSVLTVNFNNVYLEKFQSKLFFEDSIFDFKMYFFHLNKSSYSNKVF